MKNPNTEATSSDISGAQYKSQPLWYEAIDTNFGKLVHGLLFTDELKSIEKKVICLDAEH